jgi:clan AA aspartic protease
MTGVVRGDEAVIRLSVRGSGGERQRIEAVIDTGFTGYLTLPPRVIEGLGLTRRGSARAILADGSTRLFGLFDAVVTWDRRAIRVPVGEADATPLVGMAMLDGFELNVRVRPRGRVTITRL